MRPWLVLLAVCAGVIRPVPPQQPTGQAAVDSAAVARAAWTRGSAALRNNDLAGARREIDRAAAAWPLQPAYPWASALLAARARDTAATLAALSALAAIGAGHDPPDNTALAAMWRLPRFAGVVRQLAANAAPLVRSTVAATIADSTLWPEGIDVDPRTGHFFVASVRHRTVVEVDAHGAILRELLPRDQPALGAILGVRVDTARNVLWATTAGIPQMEGYDPADSVIAALLRIRIADGTIDRRWDLAPAPAGHTLGDLAVGPRGDVFVTDSRDPVLYRLRPDGDALEPLRHPLFRSLQGIAPAPDGQRLYVADWSHGLLRVDLSSGTVVRLADAPHSTSLGCDGIAWYRGALIAVQNGVAPARIMRFALDGTGQRIVQVEVLDRNRGVADEPTIGTISGGAFVYVANSQWEKHDDAGARRPGTRLKPAILLSVPVPR